MYIEELLGEFNSILNSCKIEWKHIYPTHEQTPSACIYIIMDKYYWLMISKNSTQEVFVKGAISLIYHLSNFYETHQYKSIQDFKDTFLSNESNIKLFVLLLKGKNENLALKYFTFRCFNICIKMPKT